MSNIFSSTTTAYKMLRKVKGVWLDPALIEHVRINGRYITVRFTHGSELNFDLPDDVDPVMADEVLDEIVRKILPPKDKP